MFASREIRGIRRILYEHSHQFLNEILRKRENSEKQYCLDRKIIDFLIQGDLFFSTNSVFFFFYLYAMIKAFYFLTLILFSALHF